MSALVPFEQQMTLAQSFAKSGLFGVKTPDQALALMALCEAENLHPAAAVRDYHIINGKPALKADAMLARFQQAGGKVRWISYTAERCCAEFSHPAGGTVEIDWTIQMAKSAGLDRNPTWKQYPRQMLKARCISEGVRTVFPAVSVGVYTVEEAQDFEPQQTRPARQMQAASEPVQVIAEPSSELVAKAQHAASEGMTSYKAFWAEEINAAERQLLKSMHNDLKAAAQAADEEYAKQQANDFFGEGEAA